MASNKTEGEWIATLFKSRQRYVASVKKATKLYSSRVISAIKLSGELAARTTDTWSQTIDADSMNEVTASLAEAYMSGKTRAISTMPRPVPPPSNAFRMDDMDTLNRLRDFSTEEIRKFANDFRIIVKLRLLQRQPPEDAIKLLREDLAQAITKIERIATTEIMRAANEGRINEYSYHGIREVKWVAGDDACEHCAKLNGTIFRITEIPPIPHHPNDTCTVVAVR